MHACTPSGPPGGRRSSMSPASPRLPTLPQLPPLPIARATRTAACAAITTSPTTSFTPGSGTGPDLAVGGVSGTGVSGGGGGPRTVPGTTDQRANVMGTSPGGQYAPQPPRDVSSFSMQSPRHSLASLSPRILPGGSTIAGGLVGGMGPDGADGSKEPTSGVGSPTVFADNAGVVRSPQKPRLSQSPQHSLSPRRRSIASRASPARFDSSAPGATDHHQGTHLEARDRAQTRPQKPPTGRQSAQSPRPVRASPHLATTMVDCTNKTEWAAKSPSSCFSTHSDSLVDHSPESPLPLRTQMTSAGLFEHFGDAATSDQSSPSDEHDDGEEVHDQNDDMDDMADMDDMSSQLQQSNGLVNHLSIAETLGAIVVQSEGGSIGSGNGMAGGVAVGQCAPRPPAGPPLSRSQSPRQSIARYSPQPQGLGVCDTLVCESDVCSPMSCDGTTRRNIAQNLEGSGVRSGPKASGGLFAHFGDSVTSHALSDGDGTTSGSTSLSQPPSVRMPGGQTETDRVDRNRHDIATHGFPKLHFPGRLSTATDPGLAGLGGAEPGSRSVGASANPARSDFQSGIGGRPTGELSGTKQGGPGGGGVPTSTTPQPQQPRRAFTCRPPALPLSEAASPRRSPAHSLMASPRGRPMLHNSANSANSVTVNVNDDSGANNGAPCFEDIRDVASQAVAGGEGFDRSSNNSNGACSSQQSRSQSQSHSGRRGDYDDGQCSPHVSRFRDTVQSATVSIASRSEAGLGCFGTEAEEKNEGEVIHPCVLATAQEDGGGMLLVESMETAPLDGENELSHAPEAVAESEPMGSHSNGPCVTVVPSDGSGRAIDQGRPSRLTTSSFSPASPLTPGARADTTMYVEHTGHFRSPPSLQPASKPLVKTHAAGKTAHQSEVDSDGDLPHQSTTTQEGSWAHHSVLTASPAAAFSASLSTLALAAVSSSGRPKHTMNPLMATHSFSGLQDMRTPHHHRDVETDDDFEPTHSTTTYAPLPTPIFRQSGRRGPLSTETCAPPTPILLAQSAGTLTDLGIEPLSGGGGAGGAAETLLTQDESTTSDLPSSKAGVGYGRFPSAPAIGGPVSSSSASVPRNPQQNSSSKMKLDLPHHHDSDDDECDSESAVAWSATNSFGGIPLTSIAMLRGSGGGGGGGGSAKQSELQSALRVMSPDGSTTASSLSATLRDPALKRRSDPSLAKSPRSLTNQPQAEAPHTQAPVGQARPSSISQPQLRALSPDFEDPLGVEDPVLMATIRRVKHLPASILPAGHFSFASVTTLQFVPETAAAMKAVVHGAPSLTSLDVSGAERVPKWAFGALIWAEQLETLDVSRTQFGDSGVAAIAALSKLQRVDMSRTAVRRGGARHLLFAPALVSLTADGVDVDDDVLGSIEARVWANFDE